MTNKEVLSIALQQSAYDCNCTAEDFLYIYEHQNLYRSYILLLTSAY